MTTENPPTISFKCYEMVGVEVWKPEAPEKLLRNKDDLKPGDKIRTSGLMGEEFEVTVKADEEGALYAEAGNMIIVLEFDKDERHCWVNTGLINKRALEKLTMKGNCT